MSTPPAVTVWAGTRLLFRTRRYSVPLRALGDTTLDGAWSVPVMAAASAGDVLVGQVEMAGPVGLLRWDAELVREGRGMVIRAAGSGATPTLLQRREHTRADVSLSVRGAVLAGEVADDLEETLRGESVNVSGGGLSLRWDDPASVQVPGTRLYLELRTPDDVLVPTVAQVVSAEPGFARVRFLDIAPVDTERLVALVFDSQRRALASRRAWGEPL